FGQVVLIDHGDGYFTLTGHLGVLSVKAGQQVAARAELGRAGLDPLSAKPSVYFELRHHQRPLDPSKWLRRP
ncbi:MAG: peptidoglycan DD-metalloendopeptidase family protein, partial [Myxococcales bacterium]|nr:peptidoglycan DD-metalloendopeptidase family protein [Myxococcales bacterium]